MKYKKGDKFVIEITGKENGAYVSEQFAQGNEIRTVFPECMLDSFEKLDSDYINEHYGELQDEAYQQGMNDAWEIAKKLYLDKRNGGLSDVELEEIFGQLTVSKIFMRYTPQEIEAKIEAWEKSKAEIKTGDVVRHDKMGVHIVTNVREGGIYTLMSINGQCACSERKHLTKTGRTIDIQGILEQIGGTT